MILTTKIELLDFFNSFSIYNETIEKKISMFKEILLTINFNKVSLLIQDEFDEIVIIFILKFPDFYNSGELIIVFRENTTKIYLYGKKILLKDDNHKNFKKTLEFIKKIFKGEYCLKKIYKNDDIISYEVFFNITDNNCIVYNGINLISPKNS